MPSYFTLRMQFGPHQDPQDVAEQLQHLVTEAPVDEIMFFYFAEEQNDGHETMTRVREWIEQSRPYREAMAHAGVQVSLNPWHSLLHCDRGRTLKPEQRLADDGGFPGHSSHCGRLPAGRSLAALLHRNAAPLRGRGIPRRVDRRRHPLPQPRAAAMGRLLLPTPRC